MMKGGNRHLWALLLSGTTMFSSCDKTANMPDFTMEMPGEGGGGMSGGSSSDDSQAPDFDTTITEWTGETATDAAKDVVGTDKDIYHEANTFSNTVTINYGSNGATVTNTNDKVIVKQSGAYVTVDMKTNSVDKVEIVVSGETSDGGLKIYGEKKFKLTLAGAKIVSKKGPAINNQCKKRVFVHLKDGTQNVLQDCATYQNDDYYLDSATADSEDRKGCFFSEANLIFSGTGVLSVAGKYKHGIVTDGYMITRPGVTIAVTEAAKNAIHVKGDTDDNIGIKVMGGLIYANVSSEAGKGIKTDLNADIEGGKLMLNTSGKSIYDSDEKDTSSPAGIKTDGDVNISGGTLVLKSTGTGGKGINSDGDLNISGGETTITTTGGKFTYSRDLTSSPKGAKTDGNINISGGKLNISATGVSDGSEGLESKSTINISGGEVYSYAYDDAINASSAINVSGGKVYAYAINNDGIDSNGTMTISGGLVIGIGTGSPESGIDCDSSNWFKINGGTVIGMGGTVQSNPSSSSGQKSIVYGGISATKGGKICMKSADGTILFTFESPKTMSSASFLFSTPDIKTGTTYTIYNGGTLTNPTETWNGWMSGGTWSGGSTVGSVTPSSTVTSVGNSSFGGGGGFGGGGWW
jgi:hypothetical protein